MIEAVLSHAEHLAMPRDTPLKRTLFACDELSGFVHACGLVRPTGLDGLEPKSVRKKLKQPSFAAGVHRDEVYAGAELLGLELDEHIRERRRRAAADRAGARAPHRGRRGLARSADDAPRRAAPPVGGDRPHRVDVTSAEGALAVDEHATTAPEDAVAEEHVREHASVIGASRPRQGHTPPRTRAVSRPGAATA